MTDRDKLGDEYESIADLYDHVVPYRDRRDVGFFVEMGRRARGPILEVGCGTGRVLIPTARAGFEVVGIDRSNDMLTVCRRKLLEEGEDVQARVRLVRGDMRAFDLAREFGLVTLPFRPFQHLLQLDDQLACLACIHRHLRPGGTLILDVFDPSLPFLAENCAVSDYATEPVFQTPDGRRVTRRHRVVSRDLPRQVQLVEMVYDIAMPDGAVRSTVQRFEMRYLFRFEAEHLLARSGYEVREVYADYDFAPYGDKYPQELILVAVKA